MQVVAKAIYSDGATATLPDTHGNKVTSWNTSNHTVAKISSQGHATAMASGPVKITAMVGSVAATPMSVTVAGSHAAAPAVRAATPAAPAPAATAANQTARSQAPADTPATAPGEAPGAQEPQQPGGSGAQAALSGPVPEPPAAPLPDNFIGPFWNLVNPAGGSASISNAHLFLGVPGGANHDPFSQSNQAVRVVQAIGNQDFDVAIKIDSPLVATDGNTSQGLMVLAGNGDFLTFALTTDGTRVGLKAHTVSAGVATAVLDDSAFSQYRNPAYLRLSRKGTAYVAFYSVDAENWIQVSAFKDNIATTAIGPFASNSDEVPAKTVPVVMSANWFEVK